MPSYATATVVGHITTPEVRYSSQGIARTTFSIAVNEREQRDGQWVEAEPTWFRCTAFGKHGERIAQLERGSSVIVMGRVRLRPWTGQDGQQRQSLELVVSELVVVHKKRDEVAVIDEAGDELGLPF